MSETQWNTWVDLVCSAACTGSLMETFDIAMTNTAIHLCHLHNSVV